MENVCLPNIIYLFSTYLSIKYIKRDLLCQESHYKMHLSRPRTLHSSETRRQKKVDHNNTCQIPRDQLYKAFPH